MERLLLDFIEFEADAVSVSLILATDAEAKS
jgi:hypothetical protein